MENHKTNSLMNPKSNIAFGVLALSSLVISTLAFLSPLTKILISGPVTSIKFTAMFIFTVFALLLVSFTLYLAILLFKIPKRSFAKAVVFKSFAIIIASVLWLLLFSTGLSLTVIILVNLIIQICLMYWYYKISVLKSIGIFIVDFIISIVISYVLILATAYLGVSILRSTLMNNMYDNAPTAQEVGSFKEFSKNQDVPLNSIEIEQIKKVFPTNFSFPSDSEMSFTSDRDSASAKPSYTIEYKVAGTVANVASVYEDIFKKEFYTVDLESSRGDFIWFEIYKGENPSGKIFNIMLLQEGDMVKILILIHGVE